MLFEEAKKKFLGLNYEAKVELGKTAFIGFARAFKLHLEEISFDSTGVDITELTGRILADFALQFIFSDGKIDKNEVKYLNDVLDIKSKLTEEDLLQLKKFSTKDKFMQLDNIVDGMGTSANEDVSIGKIHMFIIGLNFCSIDGDITAKEEAMLIQLLDD